MTQFLEVREAPASLTEVQKFDQKAWPSLGLFSYKGELFCVTAASVMWLGPLTQYMLTLTSAIESSAQVSTNDLLKAIAISQQPQLARELLR